MISIMIVMLVAIGFTRLMMIALELRDDANEAEARGEWEGGASVARKRRVVHERMECQAKPRRVARRKDGGAVNVFEAVGPFEGGRGYVEDVSDAMTAVLCMPCGDKDADSQDRALLKEKRLDEPEEDEVVAALAKSAPPSETSEACSICFEMAPNAVFLRACGHGGVCYSCAIDVFVTSRKCPFCRKDIDQIVIIDLQSTGVPSDDEDDVCHFDVVGPGVDVEAPRRRAATPPPAPPPRPPSRPATPDQITEATPLVGAAA